MTHDWFTYILRNKYRSRGTSFRSLRSRSSRAWASEKVTDPNTSLYLDTFRNISGAELIKRSLECKIKAARTSLVGVDEEDTREDEERNGEGRPEINAYACPERNELEFIMWRIIVRQIIRVWLEKCLREIARAFSASCYKHEETRASFWIIGRTGDPWYGPTYDRWHSQIDDRRGTRDQ